VSDAEDWERRARCSKGANQSGPLPPCFGSPPDVRPLCCPNLPQEESGVICMASCPCLVWQCFSFSGPRDSNGLKVYAFYRRLVATLLFDPRVVVGFGVSIKVLDRVFCEHIAISLAIMHQCSELIYHQWLAQPVHLRLQCRSFIPFLQVTN
jgi:hypothetical protein